MPTCTVVPVAHRIVVGIGERDAVDALIHLDILVGIGADGREVIFHREVHVRGAGELVGLLGEASDDDVLPLARESAATAELGELEGIGAVVHRLDLLVEPALGGLQ